MGHAFQLMRRLENSCEVQVLAQSGGAKLRVPPREVIRKIGGQSTQTVETGAEPVDGPAIMWASVRRWMEQEDPSFLD